jgi:hypothetical protein
MFTPPPSPLPPKLQFQQSADLDIASEDILSPISSSSIDAKRATSRRTKWAALIVPLVLVLITGTTRYLTHPAALDVLSGSFERGSHRPSLTDWRPHKRHPAPQAVGGTSSSNVAFPTAPPTTSSPLPVAVSTSTTTTPASQAVPTIPSVPPVLPTPFPQVFDTSLQANFSTQGCQNFFLNMSSAVPFNACRPFSLLLQSSSAFGQVG